MQSEHANLEQLTKTPYITVLTYPRVSLGEARKRIRQLKKLKVGSLIFEGHTRIGRLGVLGVGTVGVVVKATSEGQVLALKIRRVDANRVDMAEEVRVASVANRIGIGPTISSSSKDFILMQYLDHQELGDWLKDLRGPGRRDAAKKMVHALLNQCRKLDIMGIDHGQLSDLRKHAVISGGEPWIIDFESASTSRKPKNVTTAGQHLFIGGRLAPLMRRTLGVRDKDRVIALLGAYKREQTDYAYAKLIEYLKLVRR